MIEKDAWNVNGYIGIVILGVLTFVAVLSVYEADYWLAIPCIILGFIFSTGMAFVQPNQALIIQFLGKYNGTYRNAGLVMLPPFSVKRKISLRVKGYHSKEVTIYDKDEQGYKVSMMLIYKIVDAAKAVYDIEHMENYIDVQSEMVLRKCLAKTGIQQLLDDVELMNERTLAIEDRILPRLDIAGIELLETQLIIIPHRWEQKELSSVLKTLCNMLETGGHSTLV